MVIRPKFTIVIYCRYSSDMQSAKSCNDQEREVRDGLEKLGFDCSNVKIIVIYDEAESGTKVFRCKFEELEQMVKAGEIDILAVDDQARLSRADNAFAFITDLVFKGGRFISTGEGIDTSQVGWELRVKVMELHNSTTIRELGRRVRRGQLGRVLNDLSAGDYVYGHESFLVHPEQAEEIRGPKPERGIRIKEEEAKWVRCIFKWFNEGHSISWIARQLTTLKAPKGHRRKAAQWKARHVRYILGNPKYVGIWRWGKTATLRNSQGKKKQIEVPEELQVVVERPDLRIIDDETWKKTQKGLAKLKQIYGAKPGQLPRGPKVHHTELYPDGLLPGLVFCSKCGSRLWQQASGPRMYLGCPNRGSEPGCCQLTTRVPLEKAEKVVVEFLCNMLRSWPEWVDKALGSMRTAIEEIALRVPNELANDEHQLGKVEKQIENLVEALAGGSIQSQSVGDRLESLEREAEELRVKISDRRTLLSTPTELPGKGWVKNQLKNMEEMLLETDYEAALLLRRLVDRIEAHQVIAPGKTKGYSQLRFRIRCDEAMRAIFESSSSNNSLVTLVDTCTDQNSTAEFTIDLGKPTKMDYWAPKIAEMRKNGVKWKKIVKDTGLDLNRAYIAWERFTSAQEADSQEEADDSSAA